MKGRSFSPLYLIHRYGCGYGCGCGCGLIVLGRRFGLSPVSFQRCEPFTGGEMADYCMPGKGGEREREKERERERERGKRKR